MVGDHDRTKKFWRSMQLGEMASRSISEYLKMAQIILVLVPSSVEDDDSLHGALFRMISEVE